MGEHVIWKFQLKITDFQFVKMPRGATLLAVAEQNGFLCLWATVNPDADLWYRAITIYGTGHKGAMSKKDHVGTVPMSNGLVWHVFDGGWAEVDPTVEQEEIND